MPRTAPVMTRIAPKTKEKLQALAKNTRRSEAYLVSEAIESYVAANEWQVALIRERLSEAEAGGYTIPHEEIERRLGITKRQKSSPTRTGSVPVKRSPKTSAK
jgi:predicted transcriptional regulator